MNEEKDSLKVQVKEVSRLIDKNFDLNAQKENISNLMKEVEFLLGSEDDSCLDSFAEVFMAMSNFDFTKRVRLESTNTSQIAMCLAAGINILCEEYYESAMQKNVMKNVLSSLVTDADLLILTNDKGVITLIDKQGSKLVPWKESSFLGCGINTLFDNFDDIDLAFKVGDNHKNIPVSLKWKGENIPAKLSISISSHKGTVEALIYVVRI